MKSIYIVNIFYQYGDDCFALDTYVDLHESEEEAAEVAFRWHRMAFPDAVNPRVFSGGVVKDRLILAANSELVKGDKNA